jgi:hypothetical protein
LLAYKRTSFVQIVLWKFKQAKKVDVKQNERRTQRNEARREKEGQGHQGRNSKLKLRKRKTNPQLSLKFLWNRRENDFCDVSNKTFSAYS